MLTKLGIKGETLAAGEVELSVLLPRPLFHDELRELANELITLSSMIKPFSEIATGQVEKVRVDQISTSDPTFFLGLDVETVKLIGQAVISITTLITSLLALRKGKEQAKTNNAPIEFIEWHDRQMQAIMRDGIAQHATELASQSNKAFERQNELQIELVKAMTKMAERIEVGVQIGIVVSGQPPEEADDRRATAFQTAKELSQKIEHPRLVGAPVLALTTREEAANETEAPKHSD